MVLFISCSYLNQQPKQSNCLSSVILLFTDNFVGMTVPVYRLSVLYIYIPSVPMLKGESFVCQGQINICIQNYVKDSS